MTLRKVSLLSAFVLALAAFAAACAAPAPEGDCLEPGPDGTLVPVECPDGAPTPTPPPANGGQDAGVTAFRSAGCVACHTIQGVSNATAGPDLSEVGARAGERVAGLSAEDYLRQAIVDPRAYIVEGYPPIMPDNYGTQLSEEQINTLVQYLSSLR